MTKQRAFQMIEDLERGVTINTPIAVLTDGICWLWKWRKITKAEMEDMTDRVIEILKYYEGY